MVVADQLSLFSGPPPERRRGTSEGGELAGAGYDHVIRWGRPHKGKPPALGLPPYGSAELAAVFPAPGPHLPQMKGLRCRVRCRAVAPKWGQKCGPLNVAVELTTGELVCLPRWAVRAVKKNRPPADGVPEAATYEATSLQRGRHDDEGREAADRAPVIGLGGKPAGPRQRVLLEQLDAGKPVSDLALLDAALRDDGVRITQKVRVLTAPELRQVTLPKRDRAAVAEAYRRSDEQFWSWWQKRQEDFPG